MKFDCRFLEWEISDFLLAGYDKCYGHMWRGFSVDWLCNIPGKLMRLWSGGWQMGLSDLTNGGRLIWERMIMLILGLWWCARECH